MENILLAFSFTLAFGFVGFSIVWRLYRLNQLLSKSHDLIPLCYADQDEETKSQFDQLLDAIECTDENSSEAMNERIRREVTDKPILARIIKGNCSLLSVACSNLGQQFHPAIKCLIKANP